MNTNKLLFSLLFGILTLVGCTAEEELVPTQQPETQGNVRFRISGSASTRTSSETNEAAINSLYAILWDTEDNSDCTLVEAFRTGNPDEWALNVEKDTRYGVRFIANPDEDTLEKLKSFKGEEGFQASGTNNTYSIYSALQKIISSQAPDGEYFLMVSNQECYVPTSITSGVRDLGTINMVRRSARFDIVNQAEGITVTKIIYNNRAIKTSIYGSSTRYPELAQTDWFETAKEYTPTTPIKGSKEDVADNTYRHEIYSYANYTNYDVDGEAILPSLTIEYTETLQDGSEVNRSHEVNFIDPNKTGSQPLAITVNTLYTITLSKAHTLQFDLTVSDWEDTDEIMADKLDVDLFSISSEEQQILNKRLKVNDFTPYHVKKLNTGAKTVEFYSELICDYTQYSVATGETFFSYNELSTAKLLDDGSGSDNFILKDADGNKYKIPSAGEICLLFPQNLYQMIKDFKPDQYAVNDTTMGDRVYGLPYIFRYNSQGVNPYADLNPNKRQWIEKISYKSKLENGKIFPMTSDDPDCFESNIIIMPGKFNLSTHLPHNNPTTPMTWERENDDDQTYYFRPVYAIRFNGTNEYAAYKWERKIMNNNPGLQYGSIKIKALPKNVNVSIYDIVDNDSYWDKDYIEFTFPIIGSVTSKGEPSWSCVQGYVLTSDRSYYSLSQNKNEIIFAGFCNGNTAINEAGATVRFPLRLIKVTQPVQEP